MNYELARKLKAAGYPQRGETRTGLWFTSASQVANILELEPGATLTTADLDPTYAPDLSELIAACGKDFGGLIQTEDEKESRFEAFDSSHTLPYMQLHSWKGPTPETAVAHLWLALNGKA